MSNMIGLWSARWSTAKGWYWKLERDCLPENANAWFDVFKKDEPEVLFVTSGKMPSKRLLANLPRKQL